MNEPIHISGNPRRNPSPWVACHECDLVHRFPRIEPDQVARCMRCGAILVRKRKNSLERTLALTVAGLILFFLANAFPFLSLRLEGQSRETTLITGILELYHQRLQVLAVLVLLTTVLIPLVQLVGMLYVLLPLRWNRMAPRLMQVFRFLQSLKPWSMTEVFMLGVLVSIVKLADMAQIIPGIALYSFMALILVLAAATANLDPTIVWEKWNRL